MAKQTINIGTTANDGTGDAIRAAFGKVNDNFTEIYTANTGTNTGDQNLSAYATTAAVAAGYQPLDSDLTAISVLTTTAYGRALLSTADAATLRSAIGVGTTDAPTFLKTTAYDATSSALSLNGFQLSSASYAGKHGLFSRYASSNEGWALMSNGIGNIAGWTNGPGVWVNQSIGFSLGATQSTNPGTYLELDGAAGILAQRNVGTAQTFRVYNSTDATPATNFDRASFGFPTGTNTLRIGTENSGTTGYTTARPIDFVTGGVVRMSLNATDATFNVTLRAAALATYAGSGWILGLDAAYNTGIRFQSFTDSILLIRNVAGTDLNRVCLGGTTSAFPAIKRNGTAISIVLADDSGPASLNAGNKTLSSTGVYFGGTGSIQHPSDGVFRFTNAAETSFTRLELGTANLGISRGTGSPEGVVTALVGSLYIRTDGGASTTLYVKESGVSNTGWVAK